MSGIINSIKSFFSPESSGYQTFDEHDNPATRCPVMLLLDISGSMEGQPIEELNRGIRKFIDETQRDEIARFAVEFACVTFGGEGAEVECPFTNLSDIRPEQVPDFQASGVTPMGEAMTLGLRQLAERKQYLKQQDIPYYQPWMVLMTDGAPTDDISPAADQIRQLAAARKISFFAVGIGDGVDMDMLTKICPDNRPPKRLAGLEFGAFFEWLSQSVGAVSRSQPGEKVELRPTETWEQVSNG